MLVVMFSRLSVRLARVDRRQEDGKDTFGGRHADCAINL